jgi:hypothetical protein
MKKLDIDYIKLANRVTKLERQVKPKKVYLAEVIITLVLLVLCAIGMHYCLIALGVGSAL